MKKRLCLVSSLGALLASFALTSCGTVQNDQSSLQSSSYGWLAVVDPSQIPACLKKIQQIKGVTNAAHRRQTQVVKFYADDSVLPAVEKLACVESVTVNDVGL